MMGLDIERIHGRSCRWSYSTLHWVRYMAALSTGWRGGFEDFSKLESTNRDDGTTGKETWKLFPQYYQLMHFCDAEGIFVTDTYLDNVEYKDSFFLGSFEKLKDEVGRLHTWLLDNPKYLASLNITMMDIGDVTELYTLLQEEDPFEIVLFH